MDILKTGTMIVLLFGMGLGFVTNVAAGVMPQYQQALALEKQSGDLEKALQIYEQVAREATGDEVWVAQHARDRIAILRKQLGVSEWEENSAFENRNAIFRQLFQRDLNQNPSSYLQAIDQQVLNLRTQLGIQEMTSRIQELPTEKNWLELQFHKYRKALGIQSFEDHLALAAQKRRQLRPLNGFALYQAGLVAEKGFGDYEVAVGYYQRALEMVSDTQVEVQIQERLSYCQQAIQK